MIDAPNIVDLIEPVARRLLGEPNKTLSSRDQLRFGTHGSIAVQIAGPKKGTWFDHEADCGGGVLDLVRNHLHLVDGEAVWWLEEEGFIPKREQQRKLVATYPYPDEQGTLLFEVLRYQPKDFRQRSPDGAGGWKWNTKGVRQVLYRLPELIAAVTENRTIYVAEGEKGVHALEAIGQVGICSPGGACKWRTEYSGGLRGADVVILPDNDETGRKHAQQVVTALQGVARRIRVLPLPDLPEKGDIADWVASGGTAGKLEELAALVADEPSPENDVRGEKPRAERSEAPHRAYAAPDLVTEGTVAAAFASEHRARLRYCHHTGAWYLWDKSRWRREETRLAYRWAHQKAKALAADTDNPRTIMTAGKAAFAAGVERLAQSDRAFAVTSEIWDADPWLLGTPGGTVDLKTGTLRRADQSHYLTKTTVVAPAETPDCPMWLEFLHQACGDDAGYVRFLQQWCGYCLTGITREHALLFIYGPGGNGKSVFLNTVSGILGDYCRTAPMDTLTAAPGDRHSTDLAMLRGARLVTATETEEGKAWAEARIKSLTGGDPISARFMRQDFSTFTPQFKLTITGNHKPVLRNVDDANRRRFNFGPFTHTPAQPDRELETKLQAEGPGILRWTIDGCLDWQKNGLVRPQMVVDATAEYFEAQDLIAQWRTERCEEKPTSEAASSALYRDWSIWARARGEEPGTNKAFSAAMELRHPKKKTSTGAMFLGLRLLPNDTGVW